MSISNKNEVSQSATLAVIAGLITTLGDGLSTVAAALAIQEAEQSSPVVNNQDIEAMQQQLRILTKEVKK